MCEWAGVLISGEQMWYPDAPPVQNRDAPPVQERSDNVSKVDVGLSRLLSVLRNTDFPASSFQLTGHLDLFSLR